MKNYLFLVLTIIIVLTSCNKSENESSINISALTNKWWEFKCIELNQSSANTTIAGGLDFGEFYINSDGTYSRNADSAELAICNPVDPDFSYIIYSPGSGSGGWGVPYGEIQGYPNNSTWTVKNDILSLQLYGSWKITELNNTIIKLKSSRTNYLYEYTLIEK